MENTRKSIRLILFIFLLWTLLGCKGNDGDDGKVFLTADWNSSVLDSPSYSYTGNNYTSLTNNLKKKLATGTITVKWQTSNNASYSTDISLQKDEGEDGEIIMQNGEDGDDNEYRISFDEGSCSLTKNGNNDYCTAVPDTDTSAPTSPSISIDSEASFASSTTVALTLSATDDTGVTAYCTSETSTTPDSSDSGWTNVTATTSYC
jgi:hypothetical protein